MATSGSGRGIRLGNLSGFWSSHEVGTGSSQDISHGLGRIPSFVMFHVEDDSSTASMVEGTHTKDVLKFTVTNGKYFKVIALVA